MKHIWFHWDNTYIMCIMFDIDSQVVDISSRECSVSYLSGVSFLSIQRFLHKNILSSIQLNFEGDTLKIFRSFLLCSSLFLYTVHFSSVTQRDPMDSLQPHGLQHTRPDCPSPTPGVYSNSCPLSWWCHPTSSSSVSPVASCLQSFPESGSFPVSQLFPSGGQSIGVSALASVLPMNTQGWSPLGWTGWISLQS